MCVYCASSEESDPEYRRCAFRLGEILAEAGVGIVYGGGGLGSMGALAEGALGRGGHVLGIVPRFMWELEWSHTGLSELRLVEDMRERKHAMLTSADAVVALPGGCGTLEELLEAMTLKRLGLYLGPIVIVNVRGFFDPLVALLERAVAERFMDPRHARMWTVVDRADDVLPAIAAAPTWSTAARDFAVAKGAARAPAEPQAAVAPPAQPQPAVAPPAGRGRILVIDDEEMIIHAMQAALQREHEVATAMKAREALARFAAGERFDVIFCDMMMPDMSGIEFHAELQGRVPEQADKVVFMTGGAFTQRAREFLATVPNLHLEKPFDLRQLLALVRGRLRPQPV